MFDPSSGHLGPSVESVVLHTINLKNIGQRLSPKFIIGSGNSKYTSNVEQTDFLGFVLEIISKIKPGVHEISTIFRYRDYSCLYYSENNQTYIFMIEATDDEKVMGYFYAVPEGFESPQDISILKPLFDKAKSGIPKTQIPTSTTPGSSSKAKMKSPTPTSTSTPGSSSSKAKMTPVSFSSKAKMTIPGSASSSTTPGSASSSTTPLYTPGGTATMSYTPMTPVKVTPNNTITLHYEFNPNVNINDVASDVEENEIDEEGSDPITFEEFKGEKEIVKMNCCGKQFLKRNLHEYFVKNTKGTPHCFNCNEPLKFEGTGPQPSGTMEITNNPILTCEGHDPGTFEVKFSFPEGERNGIPYYERLQNAFIPTDSVGQEIIQIYANLFEKGYMYAIGNSKTKSSSDQIVFNVHQKTSYNSGDWGWPDAKYIDRLKSECAERLPSSLDLCLL